MAVRIVFAGCGTLRLNELARIDILRLARVWPIGQAVKTPPFHGGNRGSSPLWVTKTEGVLKLPLLWPGSSAG